MGLALQFWSMLVGVDLGVRSWSTSSESLLANLLLSYKIWRHTVLVTVGDDVLDLFDKVLVLHKIIEKICRVRKYRFIIERMHFLFHSQFIKSPIRLVSSKDSPTSISHPSINQSMASLTKSFAGSAQQRRGRQPLLYKPSRYPSLSWNLWSGLPPIQLTEIVISVSFRALDADSDILSSEYESMVKSSGSLLVLVIDLILRRLVWPYNCGLFLRSNYADGLAPV
jgi:hypothetical protein